MSERTRVVLDTDIGTDVDDCLALAFILGSPEILLEGVTCVYGEVALRGRMVQKLLMLAGVEGVPVCLGASRSLLGVSRAYWAGHEGVDLVAHDEELPAPSSEHAVDYIVRTVTENPGRIHLLAIGPLTNVAMAFLREPKLAEMLAHLTVMGGAVRGPGRFHLPYSEHNFRCDPEAAHIVLKAGAPTTLVPLDVTTQVRIEGEGMERIRAGGTEFHQSVAQQLQTYPGFAERGYTHLHDPLAAALIVRGDLAEGADLIVDVELSGRWATAASLVREPEPNTTAKVRVALEVDAPAAEEFIVSRIAAGR